MRAGLGSQLRRASARTPERFLYSSATAKKGAKKHFALRYTFPEDMLERRASVRDEHLRLAREYADRGTLLLAGAVGPAAAPTGGLLVFRCAVAEDVVEFVNRDPYRALVKGWRVDEYHVVAGAHGPGDASK